MEKKVVSNLEPWLELKDKVVFVTGASAGLGREYCLDLVKAGCRIIAAARRVDRLRSLCDEINNGVDSASSGDSSGDRTRAMVVELDIDGSGAAIEAAVEKAWNSFGRIDALINNAGIRGRAHTPLDLREDEWNKFIATNVTGTWLVSKYVSLRMRDCGRGGSIINISSIAGLHRTVVFKGLGYVASKTAVNAMTMAMAVELGEYKIRVNSISPGLFKSEITEGLMQKAWINKVAMRTIPLRTFGESNPALTVLIRYLIHDSSEYVTGNVFIADAGDTLPGYPIFSSL